MDSQSTQTQLDNSPLVIYGANGTEPVYYYARAHNLVIPETQIIDNPPDETAHECCGRTYA